MHSLFGFRTNQSRGLKIFWKEYWKQYGSAGSNSPKKREGWNPFWVYLGPQEKEKKSDQNKFKK